MVLVLCALLALVVYAWARELFEPAAGLLARIHDTQRAVGWAGDSIAIYRIPE